MNRTAGVPARLSLGILGRTLALVLIMPALLFLAFISIRIPTERRMALAAAEVRASALAGIVARLNAKTFISNDYASMVNIGSQMTEGDPDLRYLIISRPGGPNLVFTRNGWEVRPAADPACAALFAAGTRILPSNPLTQERVIQVAHPIQFSGRDWNAMHLGMTSAGYDQQLRTEHQRASALGTAGLLASVALAWAFARQLTAPLLQLRAVTDRITQGDLTARTELRGGDEIGLLAASINAMADSILHSQGSLQEAQARMEHGITEQTLRLMDSEECHRVLVERTSAGICVVEQGLLRFWNPAMLRMLGGPNRSLAGAALIDFVLDPDRPSLLDLMARARSAPAPCSATTRIRFHGSADLWAQISCTTIVWDSRPALFLTASPQEIGQG